MDRYDVTVALGVLLVAIGLGLFSIPLAIITLGAGLLLYGLLGARLASAAAPQATKKAK